MSEASAHDEVVLNVPASADHARIVRVGAAAIALRKGMSFAEIDTLRAAIDTAMLALLDQPADKGTTIGCVFRARAETLELELRRSDNAALDDSVLTPFAETDDMQDPSVDITLANGVVVIRMPLNHS